MLPQKNIKTKLQKLWKRTSELILVLLIILVLLVVFLGPVFVSSERARKLILAKINDSIDGEVDFASLSMSWRKGIKVTNFNFNDNSEQISALVKQITIRPRYSSIFMGKLYLARVVIDEPKVEINFDRLGLKRNKSSRRQISTAGNSGAGFLSIKGIKLVINNGGLKVTSSKTDAIEVSQIRAYMDLRSVGKQSSFDINMVLGDGSRESPVRVEGLVKRTGRAGKRGLEGQVSCKYNWADLVIFAGRFLPESLKLEGQREDTISFVGEYPADEPKKLLSDISIKGKLGFEKGEYMALGFGPTEVEIQIQNSLLKIAPFSSTVNNGQFNFAGEVDFKQKPIFLRMPGHVEMVSGVNINDETSRKILAYVNPIFSNAVDINGVVDLSFEQFSIPLSSNQDMAEIVGTISVTKLRAQTSELLGRIFSIAKSSLQTNDITIHPTRFILQDGFLRYDDMQIDIGSTSINFKGVIGLDKSLNMTVTLPYATRDRTLETDESPPGWRVSLPIKGTVDKPELDTDKLLGEQLRDQIKEKLIEGLDKLLK